MVQIELKLIFERKISNLIEKSKNKLPSFQAMEPVKVNKVLNTMIHSNRPLNSVEFLLNKNLKKGTKTN